MAETGANREYRDRLFKFIFGNPQNKEWTLSLYNAVNGSHYTDASAIKLNTIENAVYMSMKNDVSFLIDNTMSFYEQQSTFNPNMPMRFHGESGLCRAAGVQCYQSGYSVKKPDMTVEDFESIAKQCRHITNQLALGGRGDPNQHKDFERILQICRENDLVPNYTTSGFGMTAEQVRLTKEYCGAVAVSWYRSRYTEEAIRRFVDAGCRTNIHYVLSKNSIEEAVERLSGKGFAEGINAVIFLMHKPVGQGEWENMIAPDHPLLKEFCRLVNEQEQPYRIGFDSCSVPMIVNFFPNIAKITLDTCEGGRYSCYISSEMVMSPCSFDRIEQYGVSLREMSIREA